MRAVFFDMDGVLLQGWHAQPEYRRRWDADMLTDIGIDPERFQPFFPGPFVRDVLTGGVPLEEALAAFLPTIGYHGSPRTVIDYWLPRDMNVNAQMWETVARLKATGKVALFIATNNEQVRARYLWEEVGFNRLFEGIFHAGGIGIPKPERGFFEACLAGLPETVCRKTPPLFFDDDPHYCAGARAAGWEAVEFTDAHSCCSHPFIATLLQEEDLETGAKPSAHMPG